MKRIGTLLTVLLVVLLGWRTAQAQTCAAPTNVQAGALTIQPGTPATASVVVSFTPSASALSHTVRYYWIGDSTAAGIMTVNTTTSPVTLTGLRTGPGSYYRVAVMSNCAGGLTTGSPWVGVSTSAGAGSACAAPTNVVAAPAGSGVLSVSFTPVTGAASYTVQYYPASDTTQIQTLTTTGSPVLIGTGALPGTRYIIRIFTNCGGGITSTPVVVSGLSGGTAACSAPASLSVAATTATTASVGFIPSAGAQFYTIRYAPLGVNLSSGLSQTVTSAPALLTGLLPNTTYAVSVQANCGGGATSMAAFTTFTTWTTSTSCGAVTNVTLTAVNDSSATVSFTPGAGNTSFRVVFYAAPDSIRSMRVLTATSSPVTLRGLVPGRTYTIRVISICGTAAGSASTPGAPVVFAFRGALAARTNLGAGTLQAFPNPAHRAASVVIPAVAGAAQAQLTLLNAVGQQVLTRAVPLASGVETSVQLDLANVVPGLYTLRVAAGRQAASQRLVIE